MKNKHHRKTRGWGKYLPVILFFISVLVIATLAVFLTKKSQQTPVSHPENNHQTPSQLLPEPEQSSSQPEQPADDGKTPVQFETTKTPESHQPQITGYINYKDIINDNLVINTVINQLIDSGQCTLKLTHQDGTKLAELKVNIGADPVASYCDSFSIPKQQLKPGIWTLEIEVKSADKIGLIKEEVSI